MTYKKNYSTIKDHSLLKYMALFIGIILFVDFSGLVAWVLSGQIPGDGIYIGRLSTEIIRLIINL